MKSLRIASIILLSIMIIIEISICLEELKQGNILGVLFGGILLIIFTSIPYIYITLN